jgi:hypothetical protein
VLRGGARPPGRDAAPEAAPEYRRPEPRPAVWGAPPPARARVEERHAPPPGPWSLPSPRARTSDSLVEAMAKSAARSLASQVGGQLGRQIMRGVLGGILGSGGRRR